MRNNEKEILIIQFLNKCIGVLLSNDWKLKPKWSKPKKYSCLIEGIAGLGKSNMVVYPSSWHLFLFICIPPNITSCHTCTHIVHGLISEVCTENSFVPLHVITNVMFLYLGFMEVNTYNKC